jgi:hypothetical protein
VLRQTDQRRSRSRWDIRGAVGLGETTNQLLITQKSQVRILPPLPVQTGPGSSEPGPVSCSEVPDSVTRRRTPVHLSPRVGVGGDEVGAMAISAMWASLGVAQRVQHQLVRVRCCSLRNPVWIAQKRTGSAAMDSLLRVRYWWLDEGLRHYRTIPGELSFLDFRAVSVTASSGSHRTARSYPSGRSSSRTVGRFAMFPAPDPCGPAAARAPQPTSCVIPSPSPPLSARLDHLARQAVTLRAVVVAIRFHSLQPLRQQVT